MTLITTRAPEGCRTWLAPIVTVETTDRIWLTGEGEDLEPVVWVEQPNVYLDRLTLLVNGVDTANLSFAYGRLRTHGGATWTDAVPGALRKHYVRLTIEFHDPIGGETPDFDNRSTFEWVGYIEQTRYNYMTAGAPGEERMTAVGLEWFLDRNKIYDSVYLKEAPDVDGSDLINIETVRIARPAIFNGGTPGYTKSKAGTRGNKDRALPLFFNRAIPEADYPGSPFYPTRDPDSPELWTGSDIVGHILSYHTPKDTDGLPKPVIFQTELAFNATEAIDGLTPTIRTEARTPFEILGAVANPKRGAAWSLGNVSFAGVELELGNATADLRFHTLNAEEITLPSGGTMPANDNQVDIEIAGDASLAGGYIQRKTTRSFNRVRAVGARMTSTFTLCSQQEIDDAGFVQFDKKWTADEQLVFQGGALFDSLTDAANRFDAKVNDKKRKSDAVENAYQRFGPPDNWNGRVGDDPGFQESVFPQVDGGSFAGEINVYVPAMRLLTRTRLPAGTGDYNDDFQSPRVYVQPDLDTDGATLATGWRYADTLNVGEDAISAYRLSMADGDGLDFILDSTGDTAATLTTEDVTPAITVAPGGGWIGAYAFVDDDYDPAVDASSAIPMTGAVIINDAGGSPPSFPSTLDISKLNAVGGAVKPGSRHHFQWDGSAWQKFSGWAPNAIVGEIGWDQLCITMAVEADQFCEGVYDITSPGVPVEELVIDCGEDFRQDVLAKGTVIDISADGAPDRTTESSLLRDDSAKLRDIARSAANYYREEPAEFELSWSRLHNLFELGMMINAVGEMDGETFETLDTLDAVVARIDWDFTTSRTTIKSINAASESPQGQLV